MKKNDSVKRLIILALGLIGLCVLTAFYAHDWFAYYYHHIAWKTHNRFNVNGHLLIVALYFILLFFFSNTYGALKIGYLKPLDIFLSQLFSLLCVNVISYAQLSLMYGWFIIGGAYGVDDAVSAGVCRAVGLAVQSDLPSRVSSAGAAFGAR